MTTAAERYGSLVVAIWMPVGRDAALASGALERAGLKGVICPGLDAVLAAVRSEQTGGLLLAEEALTGHVISELQSALRTQPTWSDLPLILLTGGGNSTKASLEGLQRLQLLGQAVLLERPLRGITLIAAVQASLLARRRQLRTKDVITELEEARQHLAQANADLKQFAFAASHDLQEPLRMVHAFTQMLLDKHVSPDSTDAQQYAGFIRSGVQRMEALLHDLLGYSRIVHQDHRSEHESFPLEKAASDALETLQVRIDQAGAQVSLRTLPTVRGDRTQLSLVFQNLVGNAIKYARPGVTPQVEIGGGAVEGREPLIYVKDNGIGFEPKYAERIFDLFQRLKTSDAEGTGLGLAISRRIVERHGGRIWAESKPGEGSTFQFTLAQTGALSATG